jgi:two-component system, NtrC family, sensor histidine kinase HydH
MNRRLFRNLTIPVVPISILLLGIGIWAAWKLQQLQERASREIRENVSAMRAAEEMEILIREYGTRLQHFWISGDRRYVETLGTLSEEMDHWAGEIARWSFTPREHELSSQIQGGWQSFRAEMAGILKNPARPAQQDYTRVERILSEEVLKPTHEFLDLNEEEVEQSVSENETVTRHLVLRLLVLGICGAGIGLGLGFWLARRTLERLEQSERAALHAEQLAALGHLAAGMAHELRNPLTTIRMLVQAALTEDGYSDREESEGFRPAQGEPVLAGRDLAVVDEEVTRLEGLVRSFLDFARPPLLDRRMVDVSTLIEQALETVAIRAKAAAVTIEFHRPEQPVRLAVDSGQFRQLVLNLVLNALEAVKRDGRIDVRLESAKMGGLTLRVIDDGCGLPTQLGSRIFEPFTTSKETGLGLGLSICRRIVEAHGGTIMGVNRPEGGAEFVARFRAERGRQEPDVSGQVK